VLDPEWPIREADIASLPRYVPPGRSPLTALQRRSWLRRIECPLGGVNWIANAHQRVASQRSRTKSSAKTDGARLGKQNEDVE